MQKRSIFYLFFTLAVLIMRCGNSAEIQTVESPSVDAEKTPAQLKKIALVSTTSCDTTITNNELSLNVLGIEIFKADTSRIKALFTEPVVLKIEKKEEQGEIYSLYEFKSKANTLNLFYKPGEGFYIENGRITNNAFSINKKIDIGMQKSVFLKALKVANISCDLIHVTDDELTFQCDYLFKNNILKEIKMEQTLE